MGGSVFDVVRLLVSEFSALVLVANILAWPAAYYLMQRWLSGFAYRIDLGPEAFVAGAVIALAVACLTVSATTVRAASAKPIDSLRYE